MNFRSIVEECGNCTQIKIEGWVTPKDNANRDYQKVIKSFERNLKQLTYENQNKINCKEYIVDLDLRSSGIVYGKKSYFKCYVTLLGNNLNIEKYFNLLEDFFDSNEIFMVAKGK